MVDTLRLESGVSTGSLDALWKRYNIRHWWSYSRSIKLMSSVSVNGSCCEILLEFGSHSSGVNRDSERERDQSRHRQQS